MEPFIVAPPAGNVEIVAGETDLRLFTLYNVRSTPVNWRISSDLACPDPTAPAPGPDTPSHAGHTWLSLGPAAVPPADPAVVPADPVSSSCQNVIGHQLSDSLQLNIVAPTAVPNSDLSYSLRLECQDAAAASPQAICGCW